MLARCEQEYRACGESPDGPGRFKLDGMLFQGLTKQMLQLLEALWNNGIFGEMPVADVWRQAWPGKPTFGTSVTHSDTLKHACARLEEQLCKQSGGRATIKRSAKSVALIVNPAPTRSSRKS